MMVSAKSLWNFGQALVRNLNCPKFLVINVSLNLAFDPDPTTRNNTSNQTRKKQEDHDQGHVSNTYRTSVRVSERPLQKARGPWQRTGQQLIESFSKGLRETLWREVRCWEVDQDWMVVEAQADGSSDSVSLWKVGYRDSDSVKVIAVSGVGKVKSNSIYLDFRCTSIGSSRLFWFESGLVFIIEC